jgi:hypothetical protein
MTALAPSPLQVQVHDEKNRALGINDLENATAGLPDSLSHWHGHGTKRPWTWDTMVTNPWSFGRTLSPISARI